MNNVVCSRIPGHRTQLAPQSSLPSPLSCSAHLWSIPSFLLWLYVPSRSSASPLPLCLPLLFVVCLMIIHFNFSLCPLPLAVSFPPSPPCPFSFGLPLCSSVKALRNYSQWFFFPLPGLDLSAWLICEQHQSQPQRLLLLLRVASHITSCAHPWRRIVSSMAWRKHTVTQALKFEMLFNSVSGVCRHFLRSSFFLSLWGYKGAWPDVDSCRHYGHTGCAFPLLSWCIL